MPFVKTGFPTRETDAAWSVSGKDISGCADLKSMLQTAGLDWTVGVVPAFLQVDKVSGTYVEAPNCLFTVREDLSPMDTGRVLGHVSSSFSPAQNEATLSLFVGIDGLTCRRAGTFSQGRQIWCVAHLAADAPRDSPEDMFGYLILRNGHHGNGSLEISFALLVEDTQTIVSLPVAAAPRQVRLRHTHSMVDRRVSIKTILVAARKYLSANLRLLTKLDGMSLSDKRLTAILLEMFPPRSPTRRADGVAINTRVLVHDLFLNSSRRTAYDLWHGVCWFLDHYEMTSRAVNADSRMVCSLWGYKAVSRARLGAQMLKLLK